MERTGKLAWRWYLNEISEHFVSLRTCRLCWRITSVLFITVLAAEAVILYFSIERFEQDRLYEVEREGLVITRTILREAKVNSDEPSDISDVGLHLRQNTVLSGLSIFHRDGTIIDQFGELPDSFPPIIGEITKTLYKRSADGNVIDVVWPPRRTHTSFFVAARIDAGEIAPQVKSFIWRIAGLVLIISISLTIVSMLALEWMVLRPIRLLQKGLNEISRNPKEVVVQNLSVYGTDELGDVTRSFDLLTSRLSETVGLLDRFHSRLTSELSMAVKMQESLMPSRIDIEKVEALYGVRLVSHYRPSSELGGDYWSLQTIDKDHFGIMVADFSGHGVASALNTFRLHMVLSRMGVCTGSPAEYLAAINDELAPVMATGQFCTMLYALVDTRQNILTYSGAAAPPPIFGHLAKAQTSLGDGSGLAIGIRNGSSYDDHVIDFHIGSFLFLFSDALFETELKDHGILDIEGVISLVEEYCTSHPDTALDKILTYFYSHTKSPLPDDLTAVWLSR